MLRASHHIAEGHSMRTVLITGTSSGYGRATANHFHAQGWNVLATMRTPRAGVLPESDRLRVVELDVTDPASITAALEAAGPIDALVNNAGVPSNTPIEGTPALLTRTSTGPAASSAAVMLAGLVTSSSTTRSRSDSGRTPARGVRIVAMTFHPCV